MKITIDITKSVEENASCYYEKAKKLKRKIEGAKRAIEMLKKQLEELKKNSRVEKVSFTKKEKVFRVYIPSLLGFF